jgi:hypothetical protein
MAGLLKELGIAHPGETVAGRLADVIDKWAEVADSLKDVKFEFTDPAEAIAKLGERAKLVSDGIDAIRNAPVQIWTDLGLPLVATELPARLGDYLLYEFITRSHPKIGGIFLILAVLRREPRPGGNGFIAANIRVFHFAQLVAVIKDPKGSFKKVLFWGEDRFNARPIVDGFALLGGLIVGSGNIGPEGATYALTDEAKFVSVAAGVEASARRTLAITGVPDPVSFVGLHRHGAGVFVPSPIQASGGVGSLKIDLPSGVILALTPDGSPSADPRVTVFEEI